MAIRTVLAALAAAVLALPASGQASHEHWFYDSYQAHEYHAYPYGYYRPVPSTRWVSPYPSYGPAPAYQAPRRWFPSAAPPGYWFPPTVPPRQWQPSAPPSEAYEARRPVPAPVPRSKPEHLQTEVAAEVATGAAPDAGDGQRPADADIVTGSLTPVTPGAEERARQPDAAATAAPEAATPESATPEAATRGEDQVAARSAGRISCEAAAEILGGFGFSDVSAKRCSGEVYDFEATRDGQAYSIKLGAADGELTEVRKQ